MKILRSLGLLVLTLAPLAASAQTTVVGGVGSGGWFFGIGSGSGAGFGGLGCGVGTVCTIASQILFLINGVLVPLLFAVAFIVFLWGVADSYILSRGSEEKIEHGHRLILWGILGFVIMISLWGLVNVVSNTFGLAGAPQPGLPQAY